MSFRTNLQYLRAERRMTQEQLAMLLGVSRQSVTKWEAEKAYPEMDKLIKICQLFDCSLDDLVQGDVSRRTVDATGNAGAASPVVNASTHGLDGGEPFSDRPRRLPIPAGPATDICGYDEQTRSLARKISLGVTVIILGLAAAIFTGEVLHSDGIVLVSLFALVAVGLGFIIPAGMDYAAFKKAHPYVADFYTEEQKSTVRRRASIAIVAGIALILLGIAVAALFEVESDVQVYGSTLMMVLIAAGVGVIVHWSMLWGRTNLDEYNREWLETVELGEDDLAQLDPQSREAYLRASDPAHRQRANHSSKACTVIMLVATIIALAWLFVGPSIGAPMSIFWLPWVIGGVLCGIACVVIGD
ncbi:MAG: helix-turn-helix transcriptional regulator [Coriobacteriaceae bacterium]|nr:helix-turn-helix transcriptional regulator [Coriobacteriaceae bacterium]